MGAGAAGFNPCRIQRWACPGQSGSSRRGIVRGGVCGPTSCASPLPEMPLRRVSLPSPSGVGLYWVHLQKSMSSTLGSRDTSWGVFRWPMRVQSLGT